MRRAPLLLLTLAAAAALTLGACGERTERVTPASTEPLRIVLDYFPNADHAGLYAAIADGEFRRAGLDVTPEVPSDPAAPLKLLAAGRADLAISYEPEVLLARDRGLRVVSVGAMIQKPLTSIMALGKAGIRRPADLKGKTVGTAGIPYQSAYLRTILESAGLPDNAVKEISVGFNLVPAMLSGKVDATLGAFWNYEGVQLRLAHKRPTIIRMERAGVPTYNELVIVARQADLARRGSRVRRFVQALGRGWESVRSDPRAAVRALLAANRDLDPRLQLASIRATLPVVFPGGGRPFGWQDPAAWDRYAKWMYANRLLRRPALPGTAFTNEFLAGQGA